MTHVSSYCLDGSCVAVTPGRSGVRVHLSDAPPSSGLQFTWQEWSDFVDGVRAGEFDLDTLEAP